MLCLVICVFLGTEANMKFKLCKWVAIGCPWSSDLRANSYRKEADETCFQGMDSKQDSHINSFPNSPDIHPTTYGQHDYLAVLTKLGASPPIYNPPGMAVLV